jgi:hypothetical protein
LGLKAEWLSADKSREDYYQGKGESLDDYSKSQ